MLYSAASLTDVVPELVGAFGVAHGRTDFRINLGGSASLALQIAGGAPPGVLLAADETTMDLARASGSVGEPVVFAQNRLTLVRRPGADVDGLADLADPGLSIGLCAASVPCGALARAELGDLGIVPSLDTEEPDVRSLLAKVTAGELDAALVYLTDARAAGDAVEMVGAPLTRSTPYLAAVVGPQPPDGSGEFVTFLSSRAARDILLDAGFTVP